MLTNITKETRNKALLIGGCAISAVALYSLAKRYMPKNIFFKQLVSNIGLTKDGAIARRKLISGDVQYNLYVIFNKDTKKYQGSVEITFKTTSVTGDLYLDYTGIVNLLEINGVTMKASYFTGNQKNFDRKQLRLDSSYLKPDQKNTVIIDFESSFNKECMGTMYVDEPSENN